MKLMLEATLVIVKAVETGPLPVTTIEQLLNVTLLERTEEAVNVIVQLLKMVLAMMLLPARLIVQLLNTTGPVTGPLLIYQFESTLKVRSLKTTPERYMATV